MCVCTYDRIYVCVNRMVVGGAGEGQISTVVVVAVVVVVVVGSAAKPSLAILSLRQAELSLRRALQGGWFCCGGVKGYACETL